MASPSGGSANASVSQQIQRLSDRSSSERAAAYEALRLSADPNLRPALLEAAHHSPNPQIRERTAKLLCNLPWSTPEVERRKFCVSFDPPVTVTLAVAGSHPGLLAVMV